MVGKLFMCLPLPKLEELLFWSDLPWQLWNCSALKVNKGSSFLWSVMAFKKLYFSALCTATTVMLSSMFHKLSAIFWLLGVVLSGSLAWMLTMTWSMALLLVNCNTLEAFVMALLATIPVLSQ